MVTLLEVLSALTSPFPPAELSRQSNAIRDQKTKTPWNCYPRLELSLTMAGSGLSPSPVLVTTVHTDICWQLGLCNYFSHGCSESLPAICCAYKSMAKMRKFTPEITRMRELYGDDRQRMSKEMMDLTNVKKLIR